MADIFRGPVVVGRRVLPPSIGVATGAASLLVTTLAATGIPLPASASHLPPQTPHLLRPNADTSRGMPKALRLDAPRPFSILPPNQRIQHGGRELLSPNTSAGSLIGLRSAAPPPKPQPNPSFVSTPQFLWQVTNTSQGSTDALPIAAAPPILPEPPLSLDADLRLALGAPLIPSLLLTALAPDIYSAGVTLDSFIDIPGAPNADTSRGLWVGLRAAVVQDPVFPELQVAPHHLRNTPDTSRGTPKGLLADFTLPFFTPHHTSPDRARPARDTSQGTRIHLSTIQPPFVNPPGFQVGWKRWLDDTTQGTSKSLTADSTKPFFVAPGFLAHPKPPVVDTSAGINLSLATFVPPPIPNMPPYIVVYFWKRTA